jgi:hypothetical protein
VKIQVNSTGFEELLKRGGGKSFEASLKKTLRHALQVTNTEIPDYIKCAICKQVVQNAMLIPWDPEGRTACENCIRPALANNNFVCPLTGNENASPDDLVPNIGLRKAAESFIKKVLGQMEEIEDEAQRLMAEEEKHAAEDGGTGPNGNNIDDIGSSELIRHWTEGGKAGLAAKEDDPFGDDFGGDVFDVEVSKEETSKVQNELPTKEESAAKGVANAQALENVKEPRVHVKEAPPNLSAPEPINGKDSADKGGKQERPGEDQNKKQATKPSVQPPTRNHLAGYVLGPAAPVIAGGVPPPRNAIPPPPARPPKQSFPRDALPISSPSSQQGFRGGERPEQGRFYRGGAPRGRGAQRGGRGGRWQSSNRDGYRPNYQNDVNHQEYNPPLSRKHNDERHASVDRDYDGEDDGNSRQKKRGRSDDRKDSKHRRQGNKSHKSKRARDSSSDDDSSDDDSEDRHRRRSKHRSSSRSKKRDYDREDDRSSSRKEKDMDTTRGGDEQYDAHYDEGADEPVQDFRSYGGGRGRGYSGNYRGGRGWRGRGGRSFHDNGQNNFGGRGGNDDSDAAVQHSFGGGDDNGAYHPSFSRGGGGRGGGRGGPPVYADRGGRGGGGREYRGGRGRGRDSERGGGRDFVRGGRGRGQSYGRGRF